MQLAHKLLFQIAMAKSTLMGITNARDCVAVAA
jgi:hypothetical protein